MTKPLAVIVLPVSIELEILCFNYCRRGYAIYFIVVVLQLCVLSLTVELFDDAPFFLSECMTSCKPPDND
jgi:hypothetical protein